MRKFQQKKLVILIAAAVTSLFTAFADAKPVSMYDQPKADSKVVGSIDSNSSMVPIFTSKDGAWMKIGDPENGNVGWVKVSDFSNKNGTGFSFSQSTVNNGKGPETTIQFGVPKPMSSQEMKQIQDRQLEAQKQIQKIMQDMYKSIYGMDASYPAGVVPIYMPVIMLPPQAVQPTPAAPTPPAPPAKPKS